MKRNLSIAALVILVAICGLVLWAGVSEYERAKNTKPVTVYQLPPSPPPIHVPVDIFAGERNDSTNPPLADPIVNKVLKTRFSFNATEQNLTDGTPNEKWILVEGIDGRPWTDLKTFDVFDASAIARISFSPDNRYLAFRTRSEFGAENYFFGLIVFDLQSGKTTEIDFPPPLKKFESGRFPYMDSYSWDGSKIDIIMYVVTSVNNEQTKDFDRFRTESKQLWQYDLVSQQYTFIQTLPENATSSTP